MLIIGSRKETILEHLPDDFLLIDDGELLDRISKKGATHFDVQRHSFNPLKGIDYLRAVQFVEVLKAAFPEGENTLTKATFEYQMMQALLAYPKSLTTLISDTKDTQYAYQKVQRLLLSPVLKRVLTGPASRPFKPTILARINRSELGRFDAYILGNLLISSYPGTVVVPDFGFYAHKGHEELIRQGRLIAGITALDEVPYLKSQMLLMEKLASRCTAEDAKTLALYSGYIPGFNDGDFIAESIA